MKPPEKLFGSLLRLKYRWLNKFVCFRSLSARMCGSKTFHNFNANSPCNRQRKAGLLQARINGRKVNIRDFHNNARIVLVVAGFYFVYFLC